MNWLICGICSLIMAMVCVYISIISRDKFWKVVDIILAVLNSFSGILDFIKKPAYSKTTLIISIVCASIMVVLAIVNLAFHYKRTHYREYIKF